MGSDMELIIGVGAGLSKRSNGDASGDVARDVAEDETET